MLRVRTCPELRIMYLEQPEFHRLQFHRTHGAATM